MKQVIFSYVLVLFTVGCFMLPCCHNTAPETVKNNVTVILNVSSAHNKKAFIERLAFDTEKLAVLDSAVVVTMTDSIVFHVPRNPEGEYRIRISDGRYKFNFIGDAPYIHIKANNINGKYVVDGSPATASLKAFNEGQAALNNSVQQLTEQLDSLKKTGEAMLAKGLAVRLDSLVKAIHDANVHYADTVNNVAAFIHVYNTIDFGNRLDDLRNFVNRAAKRFPGSKAIARVKQDALDVISINEEEYNIGDSLPAINLPDNAGNAFNTASLRGKFYLIDFWATWYPKTLTLNPVKKKVSEQYPGNKLTLVSVAMDDNVADWRNIIQTQQLNWVQLIDEDMWHGIAAKTLKFDSIPFNFLVNDKGRIIAKAIKPDSMMYVLQKAIK